MMVLLSWLTLTAGAAETLVHGADPQRVTLSGTPDTLTEFICPKNSRHVIVRCETNKCEFEWDATDGGTLDSTDYGTIPADTYWVRRLPGSGRGANDVGEATSIFISSPSASTVVQIECTVETD